MEENTGLVSPSPQQAPSVFRTYAEVSVPTGISNASTGTMLIDSNTQNSGNRERLTSYYKNETRHFWQLSAKLKWTSFPMADSDPRGLVKVQALPLLTKEIHQVNLAQEFNYRKVRHLAKYIKKEIGQE